MENQSQVSKYNNKFKIPFKEWFTLAQCQYKLITIKLVKGIPKS